MWPFGLVGGTGSGESWSPDSAAGTLKLWLDASDNDTLTVESGAVAEWRSKAGTWTYSQDTTESRPVLSSVNGVQSVLADTLGQFLAKEEDAVVVTNNEPFIFGIVFKPTNETILQGVWCDGSSTDEVVMLDIGFDSNWGRTSLVSPSGRFSAVKFDSGNTMQTSTEILILTYDGINNSTSGWTANFNGESVDVVSGTPHASFGGYGRIFDNSLTYYYTGHVCEIVILSGTDSGDVASLGSYLTSKWVAS